MSEQASRGAGERGSKEKEHCIKKTSTDGPALTRLPGRAES